MLHKQSIISVQIIVINVKVKELGQHNALIIV